MNWIESLSIGCFAFLLTYLVLSSIACSLSLTLASSNIIQDPRKRVLYLRAALILPLVFACVAPWLATRWSPVVTLSLQSPLRSQTIEYSSNAGALADGSRSIAQSVEEGALASVLSDAIEGNATDDALILGTSNREPQDKSLRTLALVIVTVWLLVSVYKLLTLVGSAYQLQVLARQAVPFSSSTVFAMLRALQKQVVFPRELLLLSSTNVPGPQVFGIFRPCILVPGEWFTELSDSSQKAVLAHELAHVVRQDPLWNMVSQLVLRVTWFQPLNYQIHVRLKRDVELSADRCASVLLDSPSDLAWSLVEIAERFKLLGYSQEKSPLVASIATPTTVFEDRISALISTNATDLRLSSTPYRSLCLLMMAYVVLLLVAPRFQAPRNELFYAFMETSEMRRLIIQTGIVTGLFLSPFEAMQNSSFAIQESREAKEEATAIPADLRDFRGMLIGQLVDRDIERGTFTVKVDYVSRVWENNKANDPRVAVGKKFTVDGVTGKWLDQLILLRPGETLEFEAQHRSGDTLTFPGEWLRKVPPFKAEDHPVPPEGFRGFAGVVTGTILSKNTESHELILRIDAVEKSFERSRAKEADSVKGKSIVLAGFWGKMNQELEKLEAGERIRAGVLHRVPESDHLTVAEFVEEISASEKSDSPTRVTNSPTAKSNNGFPEGMEGFRGILRGKLVSRDVEKGELVIRAEKTTQVWKENRASDTESCRGREFLVKRISGKWLDVLIGLKSGDTIEVEAFHNGGQYLDFVSEWLKKVE